MAEYSKVGYLLYRGVPLTQTGEITFRARSNDKAVMTLLGGVVGYSDGAQIVEIDFRNAIPLAGFEQDFIGVCLSHQTVDFAFKIAGITTTCRGRITESDAATSVDNPNAQNVRFEGFVVARAAS